MASRPTRHRRALLALVLGAILAGEVTGIAIGRSLPPVVVALPSVAGPGAVASTRTAPDGDGARPGTIRVAVGVDLRSRLGGSVGQHGPGTTPSSATKST